MCIFCKELHISAKHLHRHFVRNARPMRMERGGETKRGRGGDEERGAVSNGSPYFFLFCLMNVIHMHKIVRNMVTELIF